MNRIDLTIDVTHAAALGEQATIAVTVHVPAPETLASPPVVCFAKPGGGYTREYFTEPLPGPDPTSGSQAEWHAARGWVFVSLDHLGVGASSRHPDPRRLDYTTLTAASQAAERVVLDRMAHGALHPSLPPLAAPVVLGIGQSMGGSLAIAQQGRYHCYDGLGVLGYSAVHSHPPVPPGEPPVVRPWRLRDVPADVPSAVLNAAQVAAAERTAAQSGIASTANEWLCHYDDVDLSEVRHGPWTASTFPLGVLASVLTPGVVAPEAAAVDVPVLVAMGERDIIADPKGEPRAYLSATSVSVFICPRMGHMHNFAGTRRLFWQHIDGWASCVVASTLA